MTKCYIWSVILYRVESVTLKIALFDRLEALESMNHLRLADDTVLITDRIDEAKNLLEKLDKVSVSVELKIKPTKHNNK